MLCSSRWGTARRNFYQWRTDYMKNFKSWTHRGLLDFLKNSWSAKAVLPLKRGSLGNWPPVSDTSNEATAKIWWKKRWWLKLRWKANSWDGLREYNSIFLVSCKNFKILDQIYVCVFVPASLFWLNFYFAIVILWLILCFICGVTFLSMIGTS